MSESQNQQPEHPWLLWEAGSWSESGTDFELLELLHEREHLIDLIVNGVEERSKDTNWANLGEITDNIITLKERLGLTNPPLEHHTPGALE